MERLRLYLAGPLFTQIERRWNRHLASLLEEKLPGAEIVLPQDFAIEGTFNQKRYYRQLFRLCARRGGKALASRSPATRRQTPDAGK